MDEEGRTWSTTEAVEQAFINYFGNLFTSSSPGGIEKCLEGMHGKITPEMNEKMLQAVIVDEISTALSQMAPFTSLESNEPPACFYHENWPTIGPEVCQAVIKFFHSNQLDREVNTTYIALIPKIKNLVKVSDYHRITLCNVTYKIISKTLANRLKVILHAIISSLQSAFVLGRLISDNLLAAYKTLQSMNSRMWGKVGYMTLKLDMSKAYERVEWAFLEAVMWRLGFAELWIGLINQCISTISYSILIKWNSYKIYMPIKRDKTRGSYFPLSFPSLCGSYELTTTTSRPQWHFKGSAYLS
ncbi:uncharacterized protein LOC132162860 [Corylus avellana]|uniref:uncharacterized protein LOC132162860 n=1 Tax=Corylus avellana TaxID=13451 RepID=UPI00286B6E5A|nr:uncharacterized protein LOC132162860 [Corylus avellana]